LQDCSKAAPSSATGADLADVMDEALDLPGDAGPEYGPGFSNHAPLALGSPRAAGAGTRIKDKR